MSKDYTRPLLIAGPGQYEDLEHLSALPQYPSKEAAVFELPSYRDLGVSPARPPGWSMPHYYIKHQQLLRDDWSIKEYECDEEDREWIANFQTLGKPKTHSMTEDEFETIIDRLEKEYYALVEEEDRREVAQRTETTGDAPGTTTEPPAKRPKPTPPLSVEQLEAKAKRIIENQRKSFTPMVPSWEALHCIGGLLAEEARGGAESTLPDGGRVDEGRRSHVAQPRAVSPRQPQRLQIAAAELQRRGL
eukprot:TRINITY_DN16943_c0_g1_i1.p1 TRINITY_DN16943_c0_g1~~TRINITY_DN16943_c0_g1_i1.p1  ORF type:complete len:247 (+),score=49.05 TRINITY_DN16943_c0_g1_i1:119-859(+)